MGRGWEDCDPALRAWVLETCARLQAELGANHVGTYLHGSLAAGSFYAPKSDVDILFVVAAPLAEETRRRFARAAALANLERPIIGSLECSVVRQDVLAQRVHPMPFEVHFGEEWTEDILSDRFDFQAERTDADLAAHVQATCEFGLVVAGSEVGDVFTAFPRADFLDSIRRDLAWILEGENILESPFYGVLNVARVLWVLEEASPRLVPSKDEAGEWLLRAAPDRHREVIQLALDVYRDPGDVSPAEHHTGGRAWPRQPLLAFRDWARQRAGDPEPAMRDRWRRLCRRIECPPAERRFSELDALYSEPHRAYHTWTHIRECLDVWDRSPEEARDPNALELAIWLHDAVHRPLRSGNEEESAALASAWLQECPSAVIDEEVVTGLILATRHPIEPTTRDQALLQDIDLHVLGASAERYAEYEEQIRKEYRLVPGPVFRRRRAQLLEELLRPRFLFHTEWFRDQFEAAARRNLEHALEGLE